VTWLAPIHFRRRRREAFLAEQAGSVTVFAVVAFAMLVVIVGLIIDVSRVMNVHSQANSYADRVALAAAAELDGRSNALTRAVNAAQGADAQVDPGFRLTLSGDDTVGVSGLTFMSSLGPDNADPFARSPLAGDVVTATWTSGGGLQIAAGWTAETANRETNFVLVDTTQETENYLFFPLLAALAPSIDTSATVAPQALAGFQRQVCNYPPLMICNMAEATQGAGAPFSPIPGQMIRAKMQGSGAGWGPGVFGVLDAPGGTGASAMRDYMARVEPNTFCTSESVDVKPGQNTGPVSQGMNVRFDMYDGPMGGNKNNANYAPAANVTKGLRTQGGNCNNPKSNTSSPFPRDDCFMPNGAWPNGIPSGAGSGCTQYGGVARAGDGSWARNEYWTTNHPGQAQPPGYASMSRYQVYRYELENNPPGLVNTAQESGAPSCSAATPITDPARDRRVLPVAVVNCVQHQAILNGNAQNVPVEAYAEVFLTEPVGNTAWWNANNDDVFIEVIGAVRANLPTSILREYPVLYR
jgi:hypothetical protein